MKLDWSYLPSYLADRLFLINNFNKFFKESSDVSRVLDDVGFNFNINSMLRSTIINDVDLIILIANLSKFLLNRQVLFKVIENTLSSQTFFY